MYPEHPWTAVADALLGLAVVAIASLPTFRRPASARTDHLLVQRAADIDRFTGDVRRVVAGGTPPSDLTWSTS
jgi:hypothetical protein